MNLGDRVTWNVPSRGDKVGRSVPAIVRGIRHDSVIIETCRRGPGRTHVRVRSATLPEHLTPRTKPCAALGEETQP